MSITDKQEKFCQAVVGGMTQAGAYRSAYNAANMKPATVQANASRLMADSKVSARVSHLRAATAEKSLWTREQSIAVLCSVINDDAKHSDKINAVKALNEMQGFNAAAKIDVAHAFPRVINVIAGRA